MTEPVDFDPETMPSVMAGGKAWPIPELVWRDLRQCRKELIELNTLINGAIADSPAPSPEVRSAHQMMVLSRVFEGLENDAFDRLVMGPIYVGVKALHPSLTRDEFDGWSMSETDRQLAWLTVRRQSGIFVFRVEDEASGEDEGADQSPNQTGSASSSEPAATSDTPASTGGQTSPGRSTSRSRPSSPRARRQTG